MIVDRKTGRTKGSIVIVLIVAVVLGILGGAAVMMSTGYRRQASHESLRYAAKVAAKAAAEEAALLIHNGKLDMLIDEALATRETKDMSKFLKDKVYDSSTEISGVTGGRPEVSVTAAVANPQGWAQTPKEQWDQIMKEVTDAKNQTAIDFWKEMDSKGLIGTAPPTSHTFMNNYCKDISLGQLLQHSLGCKMDTDCTPPVMEHRHKCFGAVHTFMKAFGDPTDCSASGCASFSVSRKPDLGTFKAAWEELLTAAAKDAASKVESCGSNPASAMAHLVGDLKEREIVNSASERSATKAFLESEDLGVTSTYLLEITAKVAYGKGEDGNVMSGTATHTTYRLFQKAPWEKGIDAMQNTLVESMLNGIGPAKFTPQEIEQLWPPEPDDPANPARSKLCRAKIPGSNLYYDPQKVIMKVLDATLPSAVGSRMFPYTLCTSTSRAPE